MARRTDPRSAGNIPAPEAEREGENSVERGTAPAQGWPPTDPNARRSTRKATPASENTIELSNARAAAADARRQPESGRRAALPSDSQSVPEEIKERYIRVEETYHFPNGDPAFVDRGNGLSTKLENSEIIRDMLSIAQERGWQEVTVGGSERFRKAAWMQAMSVGLDVRGYEPTALDKAQLVRSLDRVRRQEEPERDTLSTSTRSAREAPRTQEADVLQGQQSAASAPARTATRFHRGRLVEHGSANFEFDANNDPSYYVTLETERGNRTIWGKDLQRALKESLSSPKPGQEVEVRQLGSQPVTVTRPRRDAEGQLFEEATLVTHRNRWRVERREFFEERDKAAQLLRDASIDPKVATNQRPELVGTYVELQAAKLGAPSLYPNRADQQRFVERFRETLAREIENGEPLSAARLPGRAQRQQRNEDRSQRLVQERVLG